MKLVACKKLKEFNEKYDLIIASSGYEKRSSFLLNDFKLQNVEIKVCFSYKDEKSDIKKDNDKKYKENGFELLLVNHNSRVDILNNYLNIFDKLKEKKSIEILFDYSSMSTLLYSEFFNFIDNVDTYNTIHVHFLYIQSVFSVPNQVYDKSLIHNYPIHLNNSIEFTNKKTALIIGVGYEENKALGLLEYFQSNIEDTFVFMTNNPVYIDSIRSNNLTFFDIIKEDNIIKYDIENIEYILSTLSTLSYYLLNMGYRVVIAPIGPKVFTLLSIITSIFNKNSITIYRSSFDVLNYKPIKAADTNKKLIITEIIYKNE